MAAAGQGKGRSGNWLPAMRASRQTTRIVRP